MMGIYIVKDNLFAEELTIENMSGYDKKSDTFQDEYGNMLDISEVKAELANMIKKSDKEEKSILKGSHKGRYENGRFDEYNKNAEKFSYSGEEIYLLYLICNNMKEVAELLGICRQTVSRKINHYKRNNNL